MDDVITRIDGHAGRIMLNRPKALNALTLYMVNRISGALASWEQDARVKLVLIDGAGDRAFCAGGDIMHLYEAGRAGRFEEARSFFQHEYRLNAQIASYPKPYVALADRTVMGGGVGLAGHGSHRVVTERSMVAMPECAIGLIPDVGGTFLLARTPGHLGEYLGLTGARMTGADAIAAGFATHFVESSQIEALTATLVETGDVGVISRYAKNPSPFHLDANRPTVDRIFGSRTLTDILRAVEAEPGDWARSAEKALTTESPLSLHCTLAAIRRARPMASVGDALAMEYRFTSRALAQGDLIEGIRAAVVDKDKSPRWSHKTICEVRDDDVEAMLAPLGADELVL